MKIKQYQKRRLTRLQLSFATITIPPFPAGATKPLKNNSVTNRNATPRAQEQSKRHFHIFIRFSIGCHATEHGSADRGSFRASLQRSARAPKELDGAANAPYRAGRSDYGLTALNAESLLSVIRSLKGSGSSKRTCNTPPASFYLPLLLFLSLFLSLSLQRLLASVRGRRGAGGVCSASFRLSFVSFRSNAVQCGRRSLRDCLHSATQPPCIAFCFRRREPPPERGSLDSVHTRILEGGTSAFHAPLTRSLLLRLGKATESCVSSLRE